jgi:hypothetical protein
MDISAFVRLQDLGFGRAPPVSPSCAYSTMRKKLALSFCRCFASAPAVSRIDENRSNVFLCSPVFSGGRFWSSARRTPCFPSRTLSNKMFPLNVIILREQLNVKQRQAISETPAKGGGGLACISHTHSFWDECYGLCAVLGVCGNRAGDKQPRTESGGSGEWILGIAPPSERFSEGGSAAVGAGWVFKRAGRGRLAHRGLSRDRPSSFPGRSGVC